jgi:hypothetical protein
LRRGSALVYKIIAEKTGINYREAFKVATTEKSREALGQSIFDAALKNQTPSEVADMVIEANSETIEGYIHSLTTLADAGDDEDELPAPEAEAAAYRLQVTDRVAAGPKGEFWSSLPQCTKNLIYEYIEEFRRKNETLEATVDTISISLQRLIVNEIVFENTGLNYRAFFTEREEEQFHKIVYSDYLNNVPPSITAGKVIEKFRGYVLAHFMSLTGIAPGMAVKSRRSELRKLQRSIPARDRRRRW